MELRGPHAPRPVRYPVMLQTWEALTFLHWRYAPDELRPLVPPELSLDLFDGSAWMALTPFLISGLRLPFLPPVPWLSRFPETNVRTYVRGPDGEPGVWFFTLEASRLAAVAGARLTYGLPYRWARMSVDVTAGRVEYSSRRLAGHRPGRARISIRIGGAVTAGDLENFLTARYRLYSRACGRIAYADIEHPPWPLQSAHVVSIEQDVVGASGPPQPRTQPLAHYSRRLDVRIGRPRLCARS